MYRGESCLPGLRLVGRRVLFSWSAEPATDTIRVACRSRQRLFYSFCLFVIPVGITCPIVENSTFANYFRFPFMTFRSVIRGGPALALVRMIRVAFICKTASIERASPHVYVHTTKGCCCLRAACDVMLILCYHILRVSSKSLTIISEIIGGILTSKGHPSMAKCLQM